VDAVPLGTDGLVVFCPVHVDGRDVMDIGDGWEKRISPAWLLWKLYYQEKMYAAERPEPTNAYEVLTFTPENHRTSQDLCLFRTRSGKMGILQITGFTDNPRGVKIRYKLVQGKEIPNVPLQPSANDVQITPGGGQAQITPGMPPAEIKPADESGWRTALTLEGPRFQITQSDVPLRNVSFTNAITVKSVAWQGWSDSGAPAAQVEIHLPEDIR
jgi:hypothetical protein